MTGTIKKVTVNYNFRIPVFDAPGWGRELERNYDILDATLFAATGLGGIKGVWTNGTDYVAGHRVADEVGLLWVSEVTHVSSSTGTFEDARAANPTYWSQITESTTYRGYWVADVIYNTNDYISDGFMYGIATQVFTSSVSYAADVAAGNIITLIDLTPHVNTVVGYLDAAQTSEANSAASAAAALVSEGNADVSEANALASELAALEYRNTALSTYALLTGGTNGQVLLKASAADFDFVWANLAGGGDMLRVTYDPTNISASAFLMDNMTEGATTKIMTALERTKLSGIEAAADVTDLGNVGPILTALPVMATIATGDGFIVTDSADAGAPKRGLWSTIRDTLKSYFDTIYPAKTIQIIAGTGLDGGGTLSADRTLDVTFGSAAGTVAQGNDSRIVGALQKAGGTMTGNLVTITPTLGPHAANKTYVDGSHAAGNAAMAVGSVGSYAFLARNPIGLTEAGEEVAGSLLAYAANNGSITTAPSGTWRCMGRTGSTSAGSTTAWLRIA